MNSDKENYEDSMSGRRVGVYELKAEIGRGGMGAVYLAERADGEFHQRVAIKLIKRGMDTDLILKRFRRERQIIAALDHPNIAYFLSGGATDDGLPYFVMEYIDGKPLYEFCDENKLSINERLKIFRQICEAVEAAHRRKVIHRDLKPSNVLVKADGTPKLLDFGIAKVLDPDLAVTEIEPTATAMRVMTPEYASPEQVTGDEITPVSDVYALGIILYEMLTGHRPYKLKRRVPFEVARVICEEEPSRPSAPNTDAEMQIPTLEYISHNSNPAAEIQNSGFDIQNLRFDELDRIVLKTLRKNPKERYKSAAALAEDITNFLENRPVKAELFLPETGSRKKNGDKKSVAILPFKIIGAETSENTEDVFLGVGLTDSLISRLSGVRRLVLRPTSTVLRFSEAGDAFEIGRELSVDFVVAGNIRRVGERLRVTAQLLNVEDDSTVWSENFDEKSTDVLELEDSLSEKIAKSLLPKLTGEEEKQLNKRGTNSHEAFEAYMRARFYWNQFTPESFLKTIDALEKAVSIDPDYAPAHAAIADFYNWAAIYGLFSTVESAPKVFAAANRALEIDPSLGEAYAALGLYYSSLMEYDKSQENYRRAIELAPNYSLGHEWLGSNLAGMGRFDEGIRELEIAERLDPISLRAKTLTAWTLYQVRRFEDAYEKAREILTLDPNYPQGYVQLGNAALEIGFVEEALEAARKGAEMMKHSPLPVYGYCFALARDGQTEKARQFVRQMIEQSKTEYVTPYFLAMAHVAVGEIDEAFRYFEKSFEEKNHWLLWFGTEAKLDSIRNDERYFELFGRMNNPLIEKHRAATKAEPKKKSIAVLPLKIIGEKASDEEYLSIGLADAMITRLSNVNRLIVRPTAAVLRFSNSEDAVSSGRELETNFVLSGTVRRAGTGIRISGQLIDVETGAVMWSERFDEEANDILALEDAVAEKVGNLLIPQLTGEEQKKLAKRGTNSVEAFDAYMRARHNLFLFTPEGFGNANTYFEKAVRLDPDYALAYVGLAELFFALNTFGTMPPQVAYPKTREFARRALEIDSSSGEAYAVLAVCHFEDFDFAAMETFLRRSVELNPNHTLSRIWLANVLTFFGKTEEAVREGEQAVKLNPVSTFEKRQLAWIYSHNRLREKALEMSRRAVEAEPNSAHCLTFYSRILRTLGEIEKSLKAAQRAVAVDDKTPLIVSNYAASLAAAGQNEKARAVLQKMENLPADVYVSPFNMAVAYANLGDKEKMYEHLERGFETRDQRLMWIATDSHFDETRDEPRFQNLLERLKNPSA